MVENTFDREVINDQSIKNKEEEEDLTIIISNRS